MLLNCKGKTKAGIHFKTARTPSRFVVETEDLVIGYDEPLSKPLNLRVERGDKIVLTGSNGIGKTTLLKSILGLIPALSGKVQLGDYLEIGYFEQEMPKGNKNTCIQEIWDVFPSYTQYEVRAALAKCGLTTKHIESLVRVLSGGEQAKVRLCKIMNRESNVLILDEPTSALTFDEVEALFKVVTDLKSRGIDIIYITHRMAEVFTIGTHVAIMRDGVITLKGPIGDFTREMLVKGLLPPNMEEVEKRETEEITIDYTNLKPVLKLEHFSGYGFEDINFEVYPGEILGVAGLVGAAGRNWLTNDFGREKPLSGKVLLEGKDVKGLSTRDVIAAGINYVLRIAGRTVCLE